MGLGEVQDFTAVWSETAEEVLVAVSIHSRSSLRPLLQGGLWVLVWKPPVSCAVPRTGGGTSLHLPTSGVSPGSCYSKTERSGFHLLPLCSICHSGSRCHKREELSSSAEL